MMRFAIWRWFYQCFDCGQRFCRVMRYGDEEQEHKGWCGK